MWASTPAAWSSPRRSSPISRRCIANRAATALVTQFDKDDVEDVGLVKFDFLGLRTLTIIDWAVKIINARRAGRRLPLDIDAIPLDDGATFELLKACRPRPCSSSNRAA